MDGTGQLLFHLQHTFEGSYKSRQAYYCSYVNAMRGCSYIPLPGFLKFFTAGIEYHHIHHLNTRVPCYKVRLTGVCPAALQIVLLLTPLVHDFSLSLSLCVCMCACLRVFQ